MIYSTPHYIIFFLLTWAVFLLGSRSYRLRFFVLTAASLFFYSWAGVFDSLLFLFVVIISWLAIYAAEKFPVHRKAFLASGIALMVLHLFFWKYASWATESLQYFFPNFLSGQGLHLPLPVGISFFTLQGIAYVIDYGRRETGLMSMKEYVLFKSFFPQLVAGPIVRVHELKPQIDRLKLPSAAELQEGLGLFVLGLFKKLFLADRLAPFLDPIFSNPSRYSAWVLAQAAFGYAVQIWGDFSGYTDMGRGSALMLGIRLPQNFLSPYLASSPSDFWRRWHITLSQWIRDYIYIPLGGSRGRPARVALVAILTMLISGLWHGSNFTFVLWGLYHGVLLAGERFARSRMPRIPKAISQTATFSAVVLGWVLFRCSSLTVFGEFFASMWNNQGAKHEGFEVLLFVNALVMFAIQGAHEQWASLKAWAGPEVDFPWAAWQSLALAFLFAVAIIFRDPNAGAGFIYFKF